jgi:hypothetical protein
MAIEKRKGPRNYTALEAARFEAVFIAIEKADTILDAVKALMTDEPRAARRRGTSACWWTWWSPRTTWRGRWTTSS